MSGGMSDLRANLEAMGFAQLLFAFIAFIGYAIAQGRLVGGTGRGWSWCLAMLGAAGFCALARDWTVAAMLVAFALVGLGLIAALVWLTSWLIGLRRGGDATVPDADPGLTETPAAATPATAEPPRGGTRGGPLQST